MLADDKNTLTLTRLRLLSTSYAQNYVNNGAGLVAGFLSQLDAASGLTNKQIRMTQVWNPLPAQLDALTEAKISVLRSKGAKPSRMPSFREYE